MPESWKSPLLAAEGAFAIAKHQLLIRGFIGGGDEEHLFATICLLSYTIAEAGKAFLVHVVYRGTELVYSPKGFVDNRGLVVASVQVPAQEFSKQAQEFISQQINGWIHMGLSNFLHSVEPVFFCRFFPGRPNVKIPPTSLTVLLNMARLETRLVYEIEADGGRHAQPLSAMYERLVAFERAQRREWERVVVL